MPITAAFDGYVCKNPSFEEGEYGQYAEVTLRVGIPGREVHYVTGRFYGKRIRLVREFIFNGCYMTMSGGINSIRHRKTKDGNPYCQIFIRDCFFTLPPKLSTPQNFNPQLPTAYRVDDMGLEDDNGMEL